MNINDMDSTEKEIYKQQQWEREKEERQQTVFGKAWRTGLLWGLLGILGLVITAPLYGAARGCAAKPDDPPDMTCKESTKIIENISNFGENVDCSPGATMSMVHLIHTTKDTFIFKCTCPGHLADGGTD